MEKTEVLSWSRVCPFCNEVHTVTSPYLNIICGCGGKYYANTGDWLNRATGEKVMSPRSKCGCDKCKQWKINKDESGFNCMSFGFARRILLNMLDCENDLSTSQKEAFNIVIDAIEEIDRGYAHG